MKLLCFMLAAVVLVTGCAFAEDNGGDALESILSGMTLREKAAQMMIASFRTWKEVPETEEAEQPAEEPPAVKITELNDEIREMIARDHFGGILLFGENFEDPEQTLRLVADLQTVNQQGGGIPQLIFVDQEGGNVNRIPYSTIGVSNMALGATGDPENARTMAAIHGEEISLLGIHVNFAPVVDVNNNPANPVINTRSFGENPWKVARMGAAYLRGMQGAGVFGSAKHFPGHGDTMPGRTWS